jgi:hypothetical protein
VRDDVIRQDGSTDPHPSRGISSDVRRRIFWGIDINFFTLFSLSEHLVFAIEAIPIVLGIMIGCFVLLPFFLWLFYKIESSSGDHVKRQKVITRIDLGWYAFLSLGTAYFWWNHDYALVAANLFFVVISIVMSLSPASARRQLYLHRRVAISSLAFVTAFLASFAIGYTNGDEYLRATWFHPHSLQLKDSTVVVGRIVRSGERGILFIDSKNNSLRFFRFDDVVSVFRD